MKRDRAVGTFVELGDRIDRFRDVVRNRGSTVGKRGHYAAILAGGRLLERPNHVRRTTWDGGSLGSGLLSAGVADTMGATGATCGFSRGRTVSCGRASTEAIGARGRGGIGLLSRQAGKKGYAPLGRDLEVGLADPRLTSHARTGGSSAIDSAAVVATEVQASTILLRKVTGIQEGRGTPAPR